MSEENAIPVIEGQPESCGHRNSPRSGTRPFFFPLETSQQPLFALLGVKPSDKRHIVVDGGHYPPQDLLVKETVDWLDRYLGPVW